MGNISCYNDDAESPLPYETYYNIYRKINKIHYDNYEFHVLTDMDIDVISNFFDGKRFLSKKPKWIFKLEHMSVHETLMIREKIISILPSKEFGYYKIANGCSRHKLIMKPEHTQLLYKKYYNKYVIFLYVKELTNVSDIMDIIIRLYTLLVINNIR